MDEVSKFNLEVKNNIKQLGNDSQLKQQTLAWLLKVNQHKYSYNFSYLGRPIIQVPQDMVAIQELIWQVKPDLIIETGIAHGGSIIMSAAMLELLDYSEAVENGKILNPKSTHRRVLGIDIDIRAHNRITIEAHPMSNLIDLIEGSSIDKIVIKQILRIAKNYKKILVLLDSNHTHNHVLAELNAYAPLVSKNSYCVVSDTSIEGMPAHMFLDRPWGPGNNPKTAVEEFLKNNKNFMVDQEIENKLIITSAWGGYLKRVR